MLYVTYDILQFLCIFLFFLTAHLPYMHIQHKHRLPERSKLFNRTLFCIELKVEFWFGGIDRKKEQWHSAHAQSFGHRVVGGATVERQQVHKELVRFGYSARE